MERCAAGVDDTGACIAAEVALAFVLNRLDSDERPAIERRIDACPRCRRTIAEAARTTQTVAERGARSRAVSADVVLEPGEVVGRYVVERKLGAGGMGIVSLARDPELRRAVVIKLVRPEIGRGTDELEARLRREAQAQAQLSHTNVVQIFDLGRHRERVFLAMEFIAGQTLDAWLIEQPRTSGEIIAMFRQAGAGLSAAHRAGLVHRDFKPTNVLVDGSGTPKVTDFGLARAADAPVEPATPPPRMSGIHAVLTSADAMVGTPAYMAPEQRTGRGDARSDQYAFAVALVDALLEQRASSRRVAVDEAPDKLDAALASAGVSAATRSALARALRADPDERFPTIDDLLRELAPPRRRRWWIVAVAAGVIGIGVTVLAVRDGCTAESRRIWTAQSRARVIAAVAARGTMFSAWTAEHISQAVDHAVDMLADGEVARCEGRDAPAVACLDARRASLAQLVAAPDAHPFIGGIARCGDVAPATAELRRRLGAVHTADDARAIAEAARVAGDHELEADALAAAVDAEIRTFDIATAEQDAFAEETVGERAGDDAIRARALVHQLQLARWQGEESVAVRAGDALRAMVIRHGDGPADELAVSTVEADSFTLTGDFARAIAAWDRAVTAAEAIRSPDDLLRARAGRASAAATLRLDPDRARDEIDRALADARGSSASARADAQLVRADLAIARGDGATATTALAEMAGLAPGRTDAIRSARARALTGDIDGALAALAPVAPRDPTDAIRVEIARALILRDGKRAREALDRLAPLTERLAGRGDTTPMITFAERLELAAIRCELVNEVEPYGTCGDTTTVGRFMHPDAPGRVRGFIASARHGADVPVVAAFAYDRALAIATKVGAPALLVAEAQWGRAQIAGGASTVDRVQLARRARETFAAAHRTSEVGDIDEWLEMQH